MHVTPLPSTGSNVAAEEEGDRLTHDEMLAVMPLILVAGNETTRNLIGNGMLALLRNPGELGSAGTGLAS